MGLPVSARFFPIKDIYPTIPRLSIEERARFAFSWRPIDRSAAPIRRYFCALGANKEGRGMQIKIDSCIYNSLEKLIYSVLRMFNLRMYMALSFSILFLNKEKK